MNKQDISLLSHLIDSNAPEDVWKDLFKISPLSAKKWLSGEPSPLIKLAGSPRMLPYVIKHITETLGADAWTRRINGASAIEVLLAMGQIKTHTSIDHIRQCAAIVVSSVSYEDIKIPIQNALERAKQHSQQWGQTAWSGRAAHYWKGHRLEIPAALIFLQLPEAALVLAQTNPQWNEVGEDGTNLASLFMYDQTAWRAWSKSKRSIESPIWINLQAAKRSTPIPMYLWMGQKGHYYDGVSKRLKSDGIDGAFEIQILGKSWRSALKRRDKWREWTGSHGRNALHLLATRHTASFLTSQAQVMDNHPLLGVVDERGDDCINHMLIGLLINQPEHMRLYWKNALLKVSDTISQIEIKTQETGQQHQRNGLIPTLVRHPNDRKIETKWRLSFQTGAMKWLKADRNRLWKGFDQACAVEMIVQAENIKYTAHFWAEMLGLELDTAQPSEAFMKSAPEARMVIMSMFLTHPYIENFTSIGTRRHKQCTVCLNETLREAMQLPDDVLTQFKEFLEDTPQAIYRNQEETLHIISLVISKIQSIRLQQKITPRPQDLSDKDQHLGIIPKM